jgi:SAM-dependent methyltransferase
MKNYKNKGFKYFICPKCKEKISLLEKAFKCDTCSKTYHILDGIPDFFIERAINDKTKSPTTTSLDFLDVLSNIYESPIWYNLVYHLYGGINIPKIEKTVEIIEELTNSEKGRILDVACGTGIYTRSLAEKAKIVYGIDISKGMLKKAKEIAKEKNIFNIILARANVEKLPFKNEFFDGASCSGALHLFPNTLKALREIARVLISGSNLSVMTFIRRRFLKYPWIYNHIEKDHGAHIFSLKELDFWLKKTGFNNFKPLVYGSMLLFSAKKK